MAKVLLNRFKDYVSIDYLADVMEKNGVSCDRKRNGNVWVKCNQKTFNEFFDFQKTVYNIFRQYGKRIDRSKIDYDFFDHGGYFTADDGSGVFVFMPYWGEVNWPGLIAPLWEMGFYAEICDPDHKHSRPCPIIVRKAKDGDEMFQLTPLMKMHAESMDFSSYVV